MANGVKDLLKFHLRKVDLTKNASIQDLMCAGIIEVMNLMTGEDGEGGFKKDIQDLKDVKLNFFAKMSGMKMAIVLMGIMLFNAALFTSILLGILDYFGII